MDKITERAARRRCCSPARRSCSTPRIGIWLGTRSAWRNGRLGDRFNTGLALTLYSVPSFWLGLLLIIMFSVGIGPIPGLFPTGGMESGGETGFAYVLDVAHHLVLPVITLVAVGYAQTLLVMRSSLLDEMGSDYLTTARAKGLRDDLVRRRHAVPNAMLPTVTLVFVNLGTVRRRRRSSSRPSSPGRASAGCSTRR